MTTKSTPKSYPVEEAVRAQKALRTAAGLGPEMFPLEAFVGMISDEIDSLRQAGRSDEQIAALVCRNSSIQISGDEIARKIAAGIGRQESAIYRILRRALAEGSLASTRDARALARFFLGVAHGLNAVNKNRRRP